MTRVKRGVTTRRRHKKILEKTTGYYGARSKLYRVAKQAFIKSGQYAYRDRKCKKRMFRRLWITRINAAARINGINYSTFIGSLKKAKIILNRKVLSDMAVLEKQSFLSIVEAAKTQLL